MTVGRTIHSLEDLRAELQKVIDYNWADEEQDFIEHPGEGSHLFVALVALDNWVHGTHETPESYASTRDGIDQVGLTPGERPS